MRKKIISGVLAFILAAGVCTAVPAQDGGTAGIMSVSVSAEKNKDGFDIQTDDDGVKYVAAYSGTKSDITIPSDVGYVGEKAFQGNLTIKSVTIPATCTTVKERAFECCPKLEKVTFEGDVYSIEARAFKASINIKEVTFGGGVETEIGTSAFEYCAGLKKVTFTKSDAVVGALGEFAFSNCTALESVTLPENLKSIQKSAFVNCHSLTKLYVPERTEMVKYSYGWGGSLNDDSPMFVMDGKTKATTYVWATDFSKLPGERGWYYMKPIKLYYNYKEYTPKAVELIVIKGSKAEEYAKEYGIKYSYTEKKATAADSSSKNEESKTTESKTDTSKKTSAGSAAPANFKASKTANSVTLSWDACQGAGLYRVYLYNSETKKYEKYKDVKTASCKIEGLKAKTKYSFKVAAYEKKDGKYVQMGVSKSVSVTTTAK
ncbi:MAG: fibronectin type III domain-containing protein [Ruminococcus sp.]|nr:fibronectin type III domain-containing protein [Ruminococcus sp.]